MTFNSEKVVHVNAYTKKDGTHVKEHYRGISSNEDASFAPGQNENDFGRQLQFQKKALTLLMIYLEKFSRQIPAECI